MLERRLASRKLSSFLWVEGGSESKNSPRDAFLLLQNHSVVVLMQEAPWKRRVASTTDQLLRIKKLGVFALPTSIYICRTPASVPLGLVANVTEINSPMFK